MEELPKQEKWRVGLQRMLESAIKGAFAETAPPYVVPDPEGFGWKTWPETAERYGRWAVCFLECLMRHNGVFEAPDGKGGVKYSVTLPYRNRLRETAWVPVFGAVPVVRERLASGRWTSRSRLPKGFLKLKTARPEASLWVETLAWYVKERRRHRERAMRILEASEVTAKTQDVLPPHFYEAWAKLIRDLKQAYEDGIELTRKSMPRGKEDFIRLYMGVRISLPKGCVTPKLVWRYRTGTGFVWNVPDRDVMDRARKVWYRYLSSATTYPMYMSHIASLDRQRTRINSRLREALSRLKDSARLCLDMARTAESLRSFCLRHCPEEALWVEARIEGTEEPIGS